MRTAVSVLSALTLWATMSGSAGSSAPISACGALAPVTAPDPDPTVGGDRLTGVSIAGEQDAWAVGAYYDDDLALTHTLAEHWNGSSWTLAPTFDPVGENAQFYDTDLSSPSDVWAVGYHGKPFDGSFTLIEHWDGREWATRPTPNPSHTFTNYLFGVTAIDQDHAWSAGWYDTGHGSLPLVTKWDGASWALVQAPTAGRYNYLYGADGTAADDVWLVGNAGTPPAPTHTLILHWNGSSLLVVPSPNVGDGHNALQDVAALAPDDVWAVGSYVTGTSGRTLTEHWDGTSWKVVPSPSPFLDLNQVLGVSAVALGDVWAVGITGPGPSALLLHWDGSAWTSFPVPATSLLNRLDDVAGTADGELWTVGSTALGSPNPHAYTAHLCAVSVRDSGFVPGTSAGRQGGTTDWTFDVANTQPHEVAERVLGLFDSGPRPPGTSFAFTFQSAGSYSIQDPIDAARSTVAVPTLAQPKAGGIDTSFTITWSASSPHAGFVFDVQIRRPGSNSFEDWMTGVTMKSAAFVPDAGPGAYSFRARMRSTVTGKAAGYSPAASIAVH